ncbi:tRNA-splicing endonuclease subunit Sen2-like isoform X1 [Uloborus diversus]|uniref:tRNA-splicing endonuclease subunit Sen2-like isoform X1 n=1 Tax=Uloborus diversus TaxID=327109 RepID=UPI00240A8527|nr:tRNA-splicing endonuclease subunit Sen2-like isoform X1 [Uloborus diversus]
MATKEVGISSALLEPSAKKTKNFPREYPFPILKGSVSDANSKKEWSCFIGYLKEDSVIVTDKESMKEIYMKGFFGKGSLSKSAPKVCYEQAIGFKDHNRTQASEEKRSTEKEVTEDEEIEVIDSDDDSRSREGSRGIKREIEIVLSDSSSQTSDNESLSSEMRKSEQPRESSEEEHLHLSFEEAFFLSYGLGCLVVKDKDQPLDLTKLWNKFCNLYPEQNFPVMYTAYHHFRSKGWVVKSGLKYGVDFVLYKDGPPFYHSTYAVIVKSLKEQNYKEINTGGKQPLTWSALAAINRVCSHSGKGLMFLYVIKPSTMSENKISTPFCISEYKIEEVLIKRWVPSESREEDTG